MQESYIGNIKKVYTQNLYCTYTVENLKNLKTDYTTGAVEAQNLTESKYPLFEMIQNTQKFLINQNFSYLCKKWRNFGIKKVFVGYSSCQHIEY